MTSCIVGAGESCDNRLAKWCNGAVLEECQGLVGCGTLGTCTWAVVEDCSTKTTACDSNENIRDWACIDGDGETGISGSCEFFDVIEACDRSRCLNLRDIQQEECIDNAGGAYCDWRSGVQQRCTPTESMAPGQAWCCGGSYYNMLGCDEADEVGDIFNVTCDQISSTSAQCVIDVLDECENPLMHSACSSDGEFGYMFHCEEPTPGNPACVQDALDNFWFQCNDINFDTTVAPPSPLDAVQATADGNGQGCLPKKCSMASGFANCEEWRNETRKCDHLCVAEAEMRTLEYRKCVIAQEFDPLTGVNKDSDTNTYSCELAPIGDQGGQEVEIDGGFIDCGDDCRQTFDFNDPYRGSGSGQREMRIYQGLCIPGPRDENVQIDFWSGSLSGTDARCTTVQDSGTYEAEMKSLARHDNPDDVTDNGVCEDMCRKPFTLDERMDFNGRGWEGRDNSNSNDVTFDTEAVWYGCETERLDLGGGRDNVYRSFCRNVALYSSFSTNFDWQGEQTSSYVYPECQDVGYSSTDDAWGVGDNFIENLVPDDAIYYYQCALFNNVAYRTLTSDPVNLGLPYVHKCTDNCYTDGEGYPVWNRTYCHRSQGTYDFPYLTCDYQQNPDYDGIQCNTKGFNYCLNSTKLRHFTCNSGPDGPEEYKCRKDYVETRTPYPSQWDDQSISNNETRESSPDITYCKDGEFVTCTAPGHNPGSGLCCSGEFDNDVMDNETLQSDPDLLACNSTWGAVGLNCSQCNGNTTCEDMCAGRQACEDLLSDRSLAVTIDETVMESQLDDIGAQNRTMLDMYRCKNCYPGQDCEAKDRNDDCDKRFLYEYNTTSELCMSDEDREVCKYEVSLYEQLSGDDVPDIYHNVSMPHFFITDSVDNNVTELNESVWRFWPHNDTLNFGLSIPTDIVRTEIIGYQYDPDYGMEIPVRQFRTYIADSGTDRVIMFRFDVHMDTPEPVTGSFTSPAFEVDTDNVTSLDHFIDSQGEYLLMADPENNRVRHLRVFLNPDTAYIEASRDITNAGIPLDTPLDASFVYNTRTYLISDTGNHRVVEVNSMGHVLFWYGDGTAGSGANQTHTPNAAKKDGLNYYIADTGNDRVIRVDSTGAIQWSFAASAPTDILLDPDDPQNIYIVEAGLARVTKIDTSSSVTIWRSDLEGLSFTRPNRITVGFGIEETPFHLCDDTCDNLGSDMYHMYKGFALNFRCLSSNMCIDLRRGMCCTDAECSACGFSGDTTSCQDYWGIWPSGNECDGDWCSKQCKYCFISTQSLFSQLNVSHNAFNSTLTGPFVEGFQREIEYSMSSGYCLNSFCQKKQSMTDEEISTSFDPSSGDTPLDFDDHTNCFWRESDTRCPEDPYGQRFSRCDNIVNGVCQCAVIGAPGVCVETVPRQTINEEYLDEKHCYWKSKDCRSGIARCIDIPITNQRCNRFCEPACAQEDIYGLQYLKGIDSALPTRLDVTNSTHLCDNLLFGDLIMSLRSLICNNPDLNFSMNLMRHTDASLGDLLSCLECSTNMEEALNSTTRLGCYGLNPAYRWLYTRTGDQYDSWPKENDTIGRCYFAGPEEGSGGNQQILLPGQDIAFALLPEHIQASLGQELSQLYGTHSIFVASVFESFNVGPQASASITLVLKNTNSIEVVESVEILSGIAPHNIVFRKEISFAPFETKHITIPVSFDDKKTFVYIDSLYISIAGKAYLQPIPVRTTLFTFDSCVDIDAVEEFENVNNSALWFGTYNSILGTQVSAKAAFSLDRCFEKSQRMKKSVASVETMSLDLWLKTIVLVMSLCLIVMLNKREKKN